MLEKRQRFMALVFDMYAAPLSHQQLINVPKIVEVDKL
jgi:hypothetical protein